MSSVYRLSRCRRLEEVCLAFAASPHHPPAGDMGRILAGLSKEWMYFMRVMGGLGVIFCYCSERQSESV